MTGTFVCGPLRITQATQFLHLARIISTSTAAFGWIPLYWWLSFLMWTLTFSLTSCQLLSVSHFLWIRPSQFYSYSAKSLDYLRKLFKYSKHLTTAARKNSLLTSRNLKQNQVQVARLSAWASKHEIMFLHVAALHDLSLFTADLLCVMNRFQWPVLPADHTGGRRRESDTPVESQTL